MRRTREQCMAMHPSVFGRMSRVAQDALLAVWSPTDAADTLADAHRQMFDVGTAVVEHRTEACPVGEACEDCDFERHETAPLTIIAADKGDVIDIRTRERLQ